MRYPGGPLHGATGAQSVRFWRLVMTGRFRTAWGHLSRRPDSEHEQALIRVVITAAMFCYLYWGSYRDGIV